MGGCDVPEARRWKPVPKEEQVAAPWEMGKGRKPRTASIGHGNKAGPDRNNARASWVANTVDKHATFADEAELSMDQLADDHKEEKQKQTKTAKWGMSEPAMNFDLHADDDDEEEHMSYKQHVSHFSKPNDFLGGDPSTLEKSPRKTKLRASWLQPK